MKSELKKLDESIAKIDENGLNRAELNNTKP